MTATECAPPAAMALAAASVVTRTGVRRLVVELSPRCEDPLAPHIYRSADTLVITADAGGSDGARLRLWKWALPQLATRTGPAITV